MSTTASHKQTTTADGGLGSVDLPPTGIKPSGVSDRLYRVIWRWHFYAGIMVAPVLMVVAATGALYIFKDELEAVVYPGTTWVEPAVERTSYEDQLASVRAAVPAPIRITFLQVFTNPKRATCLAIFAGKGQFVYVDPY